MKIYGRSENCLTRWVECFTRFSLAVGLHQTSGRPDCEGKDQRRVRHRNECQERAHRVVHQRRESSSQRQTPTGGGRNQTTPDHQQLRQA